MCLGGPVVLASGQAWLKTHSQGTKAEGEGVMNDEPHYLVGLDSGFLCLGSNI